jgi:hypothetical protein
MPKVLNKRKDSYTKDDVYIGRPSKWGNPFLIGRDGTREEVVKKYEEYIRSKPALMLQAKKELAGKNLVCFCSPLKCHGDILLKIANEEDEI